MQASIGTSLSQFITIDMMQRSFLRLKSLCMLLSFATVHFVNPVFIGGIIDVRIGVILRKDRKQLVVGGFQPSYGFQRSTRHD